MFLWLLSFQVVHFMSSNIQPMIHQQLAVWSLDEPADTYDATSDMDIQGATSDVQLAASPPPLRVPVWSFLWYDIIASDCTVTPVQQEHYRDGANTGAAYFLPAEAPSFWASHYRQLVLQHQHLHGFTKHGSNVERDEYYYLLFI